MPLVVKQFGRQSSDGKCGRRGRQATVRVWCLVLVVLLFLGACASEDAASPGDGGPAVESRTGTGPVAAAQLSDADLVGAETVPTEVRDASDAAVSGDQVPSATGPLSAARPVWEFPAPSGGAPECVGRRAKWPSAASSGTVPAAEVWDGPAVFGLELAVNGTTRAVELVSPPGTDRLLVVGRDGVISEVRDGGLVEPAWLDIDAEVLSQADAADGESTPVPGAGVEALSSEQGLLSLAFHPDHAANGLLYTFHTRFGDGHSVVTEWRTRSGGEIDKDSARTVVVFEQDPSLAVHKAGQLRFGPHGRLWIAVGDGGASGDIECHGLNPHTLLGSIVRIDPTPSPAGQYTIPADNPYAEGARGHPAMFVSGLRNPWRFTIDGDLLIIADVGWNDREEINAARISTDGGINFGWSAFEGEVCIRDDYYCAAATVPPAVHYSHDEGSAVIGGHVYRGSAIPELQGRYIYADFIGGWLRSITFGPDGRVARHTDWTAQLAEPELLQGIYGFGTDAAGEMYLVSAWGRRIYKLVPAGQP